MLSDPICAIATGPGRAALALVRLSGAGAFEVARTVLRWPPERGIVERQATLAVFHDGDGEPFDRGLVVFFAGPASYTGEDAVEFSCHGGLVAPSQLIAALVAAGARQAAPGEFTRRAVQNGKLNVLEAEAVSDLIEATTRAQGRAALHQLEGGLTRRLEALRAALVDLLALLSYDIDFPEEDDGPIDRQQILTGLERTEAAIRRLIDTAPLGERLRQGALVVLAGRPNAGKSSLFNALLGRERALVTELPGTTRDAVEAELDLDGWPLRLADTAGLRASDDRIEQMGIEVSRRYLAAADLVLLCVPAGERLTEDERQVSQRYPTLIVGTKIDLGRLTEHLGASAVTGDGLGHLKRRLVSILFGDLEQYVRLEPMLTRERHRVALDEAASALGAARALVGPTGDAVLAAHHVRRAVTALDELVGVIDVEEVLGRLFERFCVGK